MELKKASRSDWTVEHFPNAGYNVSMVKKETVAVAPINTNVNFHLSILARHQMSTTAEQRQILARLKGDLAIKIAKALLCPSPSTALRSWVVENSRAR